ncbi:hypothetical protein PO876_09560 [Sphingobium sp. YC-XJ3]|nr:MULTISPECIES: hypothetical protein [Sphingobium]WDA38397.1 hypothetical protein PO876_09560 [Sphingobium sp. YC-XJ3]
MVIVVAGQSNHTAQGGQTGQCARNWKNAGRLGRCGGTQDDIEGIDLGELEVAISRTMAAPPKIAVIVLQDEFALVAIGSLDVEIPDTDCFARLQSQDEILAFLCVGLDIPWMIRKLDNARLVKGDDVASLFEVQSSGRSICPTYYFSSHDWICSSMLFGEGLFFYDCAPSTQHRGK